jgi:hypothetical protein
MSSARLPRHLAVAYLYLVRPKRRHMKTYLSETPTWLKPADSIRALNAKSIVVVQGHERIPGHIRVSDADPKSEHQGLCRVEVWQASTDPMKPEWASGSVPPTAQSHRWKKYLTENALSLIRPNEEDSNYGELLLEVPDHR